MAGARSIARGNPISGFRNFRENRRTKREGCVVNAEADRPVTLGVVTSPAGYLLVCDSLSKDRVWYLLTPCVRFLFL